MKTLRILLFFIWFGLEAHAQKKFIIIDSDTTDWRSGYSMLDEAGKFIRNLDTAKYYISFNNDVPVYFSVMGIKGMPGWGAIDINEKVLFAVMNQSYGEPTPDYLIENKIRIEDSTGKIGYANEKGEIIIEPKFEMGSVFNKGKAIVAFGCEKVPWGNHEAESGCHHYSLVCKSFRAINVKGNFISEPSAFFEELAKNINWEQPELF